MPPHHKFQSHSFAANAPSPARKPEGRVGPCRGPLASLLNRSTELGNFQKKILPAAPLFQNANVGPDIR